MEQKGHFTLDYNLRTEQHVELKKANQSWNLCMTNKFLPAFLAGDDVKVEDICGEEFNAVQAADAAVNPEFKSPFKHYVCQV